MLLDEDRMQRRVEVLTIPNPCGLDRSQRVQDRARPKRHARLAQRTGEVDDVLRQDAAVRRLGFQNRAHFAWARSHSDRTRRSKR